MTQTKNYYSLLGVSPYADLAEITAGYLKVSRALSAADDPDQAENQARLEQVQDAYDTLSNPSRRSAYDASLGTPGAFASYSGGASESARWSPIRRLLTVIAALMATGMAIQVSVMLMAYKRASGEVAVDARSPAAEKAYLQDFYQTYGIRAASRAEAELLLAEMRRKDEAAREEKRQEQLRVEEERKLRQFEEESRRIGAQVSANVQQAEREAERAKEEEFRRKEEQERAQKAAERAKLEREVNRWRSRPPSQDGE